MVKYIDVAHGCAGNDNEDACQRSPAGAPGVVAVGAVDIQMRRWFSSNWYEAALPPAYGCPIRFLRCVSPSSCPAPQPLIHLDLFLVTSCTDPATHAPTLGLLLLLPPPFFRSPGPGPQRQP